MSELERLIELVLRDLYLDGAEIPYVTLTEDSGSPGYTDVLVEDSSGMGCGFRVDTSASEQNILCSLADRIPDAYVELFAVGLPVVPGSSRPARPKILNGMAVWVDPSHPNSWTCPVGEMAPHSGIESSGGQFAARVRRVPLDR
ncbi:hypothetical protein ACFU6R_31660 [Streptomyces sp. NPDC057499]|uniref:hypothetical protein n=1 Tax=Streptomyces sp. NPDC057499 TaxID=3346150 RepID=UPI0036D0766C